MQRCFRRRHREHLWTETVGGQFDLEDDIISIRLTYTYAMTDRIGRSRDCRRTVPSPLPWTISDEWRGL